MAQQQRLLKAGAGWARLPNPAREGQPQECIMVNDIAGVAGSETKGGISDGRDKRIIDKTGLCDKTTV